ncbi:MAG: PspC domain-containing protein, partial [Longilinea sp.]|nr:PspC domain-containing protein [Longilinea sp.]
ADQMIGGVCSGLGSYLTIDPTLVRLIFVLLFLFGGNGLLIYIILWIIVPIEPELPASGSDQPPAVS